MVLYSIFLKYLYTVLNAEKLIEVYASGILSYLFDLSSWKYKCPTQRSILYCTVVVRSECFDNAVLSYLSIMEGDTKCP
jgi:hypothetical protein